MNRRGFLTGLVAAPAVILTPGLLMPVKRWTGFVTPQMFGAIPTPPQSFYQVNFYKNGLWVGGTNPTKGHYARVDFEQTESFTAGDTMAIEWAGLEWRG